MSNLKEPKPGSPKTWQITQKCRPNRLSKRRLYSHCGDNCSFYKSNHWKQEQLFISWPAPWQHKFLTFLLAKRKRVGIPQDNVLKATLTFVYFGFPTHAPVISFFFLERFFIFFSCLFCLCKQFRLKLASFHRTSAVFRLFASQKWVLS